ncbi:Uncharacterized protein FWK35_00031677 [Aphis craccivora]|uniref:Uncharacterized protein n=1 Tax=Aphis craccivora TaxID=307492 RepID=A0A6G0VZF4_APHCR|nr:Uncharacterized protein FWK35_00031677 [Aphis craccivora]
MSVQQGQINNEEGTNQLAFLFDDNNAAGEEFNNVQSHITVMKDISDDQVNYRDTFVDIHFDLLSKDENRLKRKKYYSKVVKLVNI